MVLQNKYKARASARYRSSRGGGRGSGRGRVRGGGVGQRTEAGWAATSGENDEYESGQEEDAEEEEADSDGHEAQTSASGSKKDAAFPSLQSATRSATDQPSQQGREQEEAEKQQRSKYARRKLESNAWKFEQDVKDPHLPDSDPEPEVDISGLVERVKQMDSSRDYTKGTIQGVRDANQEQEERVMLDQDVDWSLSYLDKRERDRQKGKGRHVEEDLVGLRQKPVQVENLTLEEKEAQKRELEEMLKEKEKSEALRALKERFQGRAVGERPKESRTVSLAAGATGHAGSFKLPTVGPGRSSAGQQKPSTLVKGRQREEDDEEGGKNRREDMEDFLDAMLG